MTQAIIASGDWASLSAFIELGLHGAARHPLTTMRTVRAAAVKIIAMLPTRVDARCVFEAPDGDRPGRKRQPAIEFLSLTADEWSQYRQGFESLGPSGRRVPGRPFSSEVYASYCRVNRLCAEAVLAAVTVPDPLILVEDSRLALVPQMIRPRLDRCTIAAKWTAPWPEAGAFDCSPWGMPIVEGLLGADLILMNTPCDRLRFTSVVRRYFGGTFDESTGVLTYTDRRIAVGLASVDERRDLSA
jgi:hypothetical protein